MCTRYMKMTNFVNILAVFLLSIVVTTQAVVTTTASGGLPNKPAVGNWTAKSNDGKTYCIRADMGVRLDIQYNTTDNKTETVTLDIPTDASSDDSKCEEKNQYLKLAWQPQKGGTTNWKFTLRFNVSEKIFVGQVEMLYVLNKENFPNISYIPPPPSTVDLKKEGKYFEVDPRASYLCNTEQEIDMGSVKINLYDLQIQGNMSAPVQNTTNLPDFATASQCEADLETNNIVPIAVGAALAGLVVIVLIAYLISRNRSKRGYESV